MHHASLSVVLLSTAAMAGDWVTLFDGTSLDGWRVAAENPKAFTVKDETLVVNGERGHLFWSGKDGQDRKWDDFEFEAMVRTQPGANSGVFFHTKFKNPAGQMLATSAKSTPPTETASRLARSTAL